MPMQEQPENDVLRALLRVPAIPALSAGSAAAIRRRAAVPAICAIGLLVFCAAIVMVFPDSGPRSPSPADTPLTNPDLSALAFDEPITPIPPVPTGDPLKIALGERLFGDPRLSGDRTRSCVTCHDVHTNGAT